LDKIEGAIKDGQSRDNGNIGNTILYPELSFLLLKRELIWISDLFSSLLIFTIIKTILSTFFFTVSKFYKNLVRRSNQGWTIQKQWQHREQHSLSRVVVPATLHNITVNAHFTRFL
jgi:hypothetical protein